MTVMRGPEVRIHLVLSVVTAVLGLFLHLLGAAALKKGFFLPEYATVLRGCGTVFLILGLLWLGLSAIGRAQLPPEKVK